jgi:hypothetical protein
MQAKALLPFRDSRGGPAIFQALWVLIVDRLEKTGVTRTGRAAPSRLGALAYLLLS